MKKANSTTAIDVDQYLANVREPARTTLQKVRATIRSVLPPEATEAISYGMPAVKCNGTLVSYAAFTDHCSFFPMSYAVIEAFQDELKDRLSSKGTIRFPLDKPLSASLVKSIVKARIAENEQKRKRR